MTAKRNQAVLLTVLLLGLVFCAWLSLFTGVRDIRYADLWRDQEKLMVFIISRIPRTLALALVGAGMSIAGVIMQQLSQNRFVSPTTSGTLDAAKMGVLMALILVPNVSLTGRLFFSMGFTFLFSALFVFFVGKIKLKDAVFIPLVGIMFGNILSAISTFFAYKNNIVQNVQEWLLGDFSAVMQGQYESIYIILPAVLIAYLYADRFTLAGMGESFSVNLGLSYKTIVGLGLLSASTVISATMITVGAIPFVGLIIPNVVRVFIGDNLRKSLPVIALTGGIFLLICDIFGRLIVAPYEIPIGVTVGVVGGIGFLILILRKRA